MSERPYEGLRVALVHDWLTGMRGGEKVLESLSTLFPQATIFCLFHFRGTVSPRIEAHEIQSTWLRRMPFLRRHYRYFLPFFPAAIESLDLEGFDLVISSSHCVAKGVIPRSAPHVCYCHTPVRYAWDQEDAYFPEARGPIGKARKRLLARLRTWDRKTAGRVGTYVANSRFVAERIGRYYGRPAKVVAPPVDTLTFRPGEQASSGERFALSVAALAPYKRHDVAIAACKELDLELRIVGTGPDEGRLRQLASGTTTKLLGRVDADELLRLYRAAAVFVQPGIEDFGIAAAESLACGTPVAALGVGGVRDIVVDEAHGALATEEGSASDLASAIERALDLDASIASLRERAEIFSEARFRSAFLDVLANAAPELSP
ncbi:MAG: glycosyltransferase [Acidobacteriota bacterium]